MLSQTTTAYARKPLIPVHHTGHILSLQCDACYSRTTRPVHQSKHAVLVHRNDSMQPVNITVTSTLRMKPEIQEMLHFKKYNNKVHTVTTYQIITYMGSCVDASFKEYI